MGYKNTCQSQPAIHPHPILLRQSAPADLPVPPRVIWRHNCSRFGCLGERGGRHQPQKKHPGQWKSMGRSALSVGGQWHRGAALWASSVPAWVGAYKGAVTSLPPGVWLRVYRKPRGSKWLLCVSDCWRLGRARAQIATRARIPHPKTAARLGKHTKTEGTPPAACRAYYRDACPMAKPPISSCHDMPLGGPQRQKKCLLCSKRRCP